MDNNYNIASVNHQINLYVFSRICMGMIRSGIERGWFKNYKFGYYIFASMTWAIVMYLFEFESHNISRSLKKSMVYLYHNEMKIPSNINELKTWITSSFVPI